MHSEIRHLNHLTNVPIGTGHRANGGGVGQAIDLLHYNVVPPLERLMYIVNLDI